MAQLVRKAPRLFVPFAIMAALLLAPVLVTLLGGDGLPPDLAQRGGWLLAQALGGFAIAVVLAVGAWWLRRGRVG
jgi:hypothetical protein